jgi:DNA-binding NarL/FixJ family response regulator
MMAFPLSVPTRAELAAHGLSDWDISLLEALMVGCDSEKEIARRLGRSAPAVRKRFQVIRKKLGAKNQLDLVRMLTAMAVEGGAEERR